MKRTTTEEGLRADRQLDRRIGEVLRSIRQSQKMSMGALGEQIGVTYQQIQKYETGANRIPASALFRLAKILDCDIGMFFEGLDAEPATHGDRPGPKDAAAARALDRIEDPVVQDALRHLIHLLEGGPADD